MLDRTKQPGTNSLDKIDIRLPERRVMPNGSMLNIIKAGDQEVVRLDLIFKGGRYQQTESLQALFTNRMLREGSRKYTSGEIEEKLDYYGAWLELSSAMEHSYLTLYSLGKYFAQTLEVIESIVKEPTFPEKELRTTLDVNKQQFLVNSTKVNFISQKYFNLSVFGPEHPSGKTITAEDYETLGRESLCDFHAHYYHSNNCSIYLSGKITEDIIKRVENAFGNSAWGDVTQKYESSLFPLSLSKEKRLFIERPDAMQSSLRIGGVTMNKNNPDYLKMNVLMTLFGGYFGSRLMSNIREDKGYTYGISAGIMFYSETGILMVSTEADNEYVEDIIREVYHEMDVLKNEPVSSEELSMVKNYMLGSMCRSYEGPFSLADAWIFVESGHFDDDYFQSSLDAVRSVTHEEMKELASKYFHRDDLTEVIAGKKIYNKL